MQGSILGRILAHDMESRWLFTSKASNRFISSWVWSTLKLWEFYLFLSCTPNSNVEGQNCGLVKI